MDDNNVLVSVAEYKRNYKKYKPNSREVNFHKDREAVIKGGKVIAIKKFNPNVYIKFKDNECQDLKKDWVASSFNSNGRIKKAINECVKHIKEIKK